MSELSPVLQMLGKMLKASATAIVNTAIENPDLTIKAGRVVKSIAAEYNEVMSDYEAHCEDSFALLDDIVESIQHSDDDSDSDSIPVEEQHVTLDNGYRTYGSD